MIDMPQLIGLCPEHKDEFYVPHGGKCPIAGCEFELWIYRLDHTTAKPDKEG